MRRSRLVAFASTAAAAERVRMGKAVPFAWTFTPIDVGIEVGTFAKQGLELEVPASLATHGCSRVSSPTASISA